MTEAELQNQVIKLAQSLGHLVHHDADSRKNPGNPGFPDLVIAGRHRVLFAELKDSRGDRSSGQTAWYYRLVATGQFVVLWHPKDWENGQIETILKEL